jgi:hypothetical protein
MLNISDMRNNNDACVCVCKGENSVTCVGINDSLSSWLACRVEWVAATDVDHLREVGTNARTTCCEDTSQVSGCHVVRESLGRILRSAA